MNREERRRQAHKDRRAARKKPVLVAGDGIIAAALGAKYEARPAAQIRAKIMGEHRWVATGAWVLGDLDVEHASDVDHMKLLDNENLMYLAIGCWDCEKPLGEIKYGSRCEARDSGDDPQLREA